MTPFNRGRAAQALAWRRDGFRLRQIAEQFSVSQERARQLILRGQAMERDNHDPHHPKHELTTRTRNALVMDGCEPTPQAVAARYKTVRELLRILNVGHKCVDEIQVWLMRHGQEPRCK